MFKRIAVISAVTGALLMIPLTAIASVSASTGTQISGINGKECSSTNPQYMINAGGSTLELQPTHAKFTVESTQSGIWADPYITAGYNDSVSSELCNSHEIPGSGGKYYRSYALPVLANSDGYPTASIHDDTPGGMRGDSGLDIWLTSNPASTTYNEMANGGSNSTEVMVWTNHPRLGTQSSNLRYYPVRIDGRHWQITVGLAIRGHGRNSAHPNGWNVVNFIAPQYTTGNVQMFNIHVNQFISYVEHHGWANPHDYLMAIDNGFEILNGGKGAAVEGYTLTDVR